MELLSITYISNIITVILIKLTKKGDLTRVTVSRLFCNESGPNLFPRTN